VLGSMLARMSKALKSMLKYNGGTKKDFKGIKKDVGRMSKRNIECIRKIVKEYQTCCEKINLNLCSNKLSNFYIKKIIGRDEGGGRPLNQPQMFIRMSYF